MLALAGVSSCAGEREQLRSFQIMLALVGVPPPQKTPASASMRSCFYFFVSRSSPVRSSEAFITGCSSILASVAANHGSAMTGIWLESFMSK